MKINRRDGLKDAHKGKNYEMELFGTDADVYFK